MKILVCGLSGSGKTWLCRELRPLIGAVLLNNDAIRNGPHAGIGWTLENRIEHARLVGLWANIIQESGYPVLIDMICPTKHTREALGPDYIVFVDTVSKSKFADTDALFVPPVYEYDYLVLSQDAKLWAERIAKSIKRVLGS